ncbi:MAG: PD-(D/E)XK nuclease family transposase, partial [Candidatus Cryptobacteroides sp.]|nr:PD-(D/E)XK nuclease family transposase [Bacteroidales bacterium]MDY5744603.1 PD-(D/E)XK nuclease family transposase [Candidatus Cryptobacteroides sp.]
MNRKQKKSNGVPERDSKGRLFVNLMEDSGFKAVFADKDNKKLLVSMLNHLLPDYVRVKDIKHYRDREKTPDYLGAKKTILDLCCEGEDGSLFDIEVQQSDSP